MKLNIEVDLSDFSKDCYRCTGDETTIEEFIQASVVNKLVNEISSSKHWQSTYVVNRVLDEVLKSSSDTINPKFEEAIEKKINRSNITTRVDKKFDEITNQEIENRILKRINFTDIIRSETRKIMEEKLK